MRFGEDWYAKKLGAAVPHSGLLDFQDFVHLSTAIGVKPAYDLFYWHQIE